MSFFKLIVGMLVITGYAATTELEGNAIIAISIIYAAWMISDALDDIKIDLRKMRKGEKT